MLPVAVRFPLLVSAPLARRFSTEISPVTSRLTATTSASELSLMRTSPAIAGFSPFSVSMPSTVMLLNWFFAFSSSRDLLLMVLTASAVMIPLSVWVIAPLIAFRVSVFLEFVRLPTVAVPFSVRSSVAERVALPPVVILPVTSSFTTFPALVSSSRPTAMDPSLSATNSPLVVMIPRTRVPFWMPRARLPMPRI